jgi:hypothetical protein
MSRSAFLSSLPILVTGNSATIYGDFTGRVAALGQQRREQAAGAAAEHRYPHLRLLHNMFHIIDERCFNDTQ